MFKNREDAGRLKDYLPAAAAHLFNLLLTLDATDATKVFTFVKSYVQARCSADMNVSKLLLAVNLMTRGEQ